MKKLKNWKKFNETNSNSVQEKIFTRVRRVMENAGYKSSIKDDTILQISDGYVIGYISMYMNDNWMIEMGKDHGKDYTYVLEIAVLDDPQPENGEIEYESTNNLRLIPVNVNDLSFDEEEFISCLKENEN